LTGVTGIWNNRGMTEMWRHAEVQANGVRIHFVRAGQGEPLLMLHGWPEFWRVWRKNIPVLAQGFDVVAPDLRGFGQSEKPSLSAIEGYSLEHHVEDLAALADRLGLGKFGLVSHDVGAFVAQAFARKYPGRVTRLFFFDCPYPGIGKRWVEPGHLREIWYQSFHQLPLAVPLVASSRAACEIYFRWFLDHWSHAPGAFEPDLQEWIDNFLAPGNLQGGFNWYIAIAEARERLMREGAPALPKIPHPTCVRWGASDKVLKVAWADRLGDYFADLDFAAVPSAGHFVAYERPDYANREIAKFFGRPDIA
jgi:pimeloyl-ACP methyl ester carboxylesterase